MGASKETKGTKTPKRRISDDTKRDILNRLCISAAPQAGRSGSGHIAGHSVPDDPGVPKNPTPRLWNGWGAKTRSGILSL